jgi:protein O-GlcNAc transferase
MARSKYSKPSKAAWLRFPIQPSEIQSPSSTKKKPKFVGIHANLQLEAWARPSVQSHFQLGHAFYLSGHMAESIACYKQALLLDPQSAASQWNLALSYEALGNFEEALHSYVDVIKQNAGYADGAFGNLMALQETRYPINMPRQMENFKLFNRYLAQESPVTQTEHSAIQPHKPLRIGFVSPDFRFHPVGFFIESTLEQIRQNADLSDRLEFVAYHNHEKQDDLTFRLSEYFDQWYRTDQWSDDRLIDQIKRDRIDILVDLAGHTIGHRLPIFARKAVPLQVSWLGYWGSTGLSAIDYVLADPITVPVHEEQWFVEKIWRLPHLRYCFSMPEDAPEVSPSPCLDSQQIVLGCYQKLFKINQSVLQCWARILDAAPNARLRIQAFDLDKIDVKKQLISSLKDYGLDLRRIELLGFMNRQEYLASYAEVDILLDTFPYPGGTTTAEAMWMGVPTLTLAVPNMLGRQGEALMVNAGLSDWVAHSEDEYVQKAIKWANADSEKRQQLNLQRQSMRDQLMQSPVFNSKQFAHELVDAFYGMWQKKCSEQAADATQDVQVSAAKDDQDAKQARFNAAVSSFSNGDEEGVFREYQHVVALNENPEDVAEAFANMNTLNLFRHPFDFDFQKQFLKSFSQHYESESLAQHVAVAEDKRSLPVPLRVGFISGDFRNHPISFFLESMLTQLKRNPDCVKGMMVFGYYNYDKQDDYTFRLKQKFDGWRYIDGWSDDLLIEQIKRDQIDVLIDLSGHTQCHRLPIFTRKIVPLQVTWLGYWGSTGLSSIDYLLADPVTVRPEDNEYFSEKVWYLPHLRYCFSIPIDAPAVSPLPCLKRKKFVFGCYQRLSKVNINVLQCWLRILEASPDAMIRIQMPELEDEEVKATFVSMLERAGFDMTQIELFGKTYRKDYLASYAKVDIVLDTFHFPGGTTTIEALWMGVPTLSLSLPGMLGRQGDAILSNAGLAGWVVHSEEEYVQEAVAWANADQQYRDVLSTLRQGMREKIKNTPLFNAEQFTQEFVDAIHGMWNEKYPQSVND